MANVKFSRKEFEQHIKISEDLIEKINLMGIPVESVTDNEIEIEVLPNRPDLLSMHGFLRALKSFIGKEKGMKIYEVKKPGKDYEVYIKPSLKNIRPYTACAILKNLSLNSERIKEIIDLQEKLHSTIGRKRKKVAIGIYPLDKIKLPITYTALPPEKIKFIPLEAEKEMSASQILQKHPTGKEYSHLLENFQNYPVFIDASNKILSMPPIINSAETGRVDQSTKEVFIECSGSDFNVLKKTLNIIVTSLAETGATIHSIDLLYERSKETTPNLKPESMKISLDNANAILGLNLKEKDLENLLPKMGYNIDKLKIEIPSWRTDILHEIDVIEDLAIAYGYNNLISEIPNIATIAEEAKESKIKAKISEILVGLGLIETSSYHLIKKEEAEQCLKQESLIELENSKTDYKFLRPNLLIPILRTYSENKDNEYPQKLFEIGTVFTRENKLEDISEHENLIIALSPSNFTEIKQVLEYLTKILGIKIELKEGVQKDVAEGRASALFINNIRIGYMGEVHPKTLQDWNIKMPVAVLEISLKEIFNLL